MVKTRAQLKAQKDAFLIDNSGNNITPAQFNTLFEDMLDSAFLAEDDYTYPASVETINIISGSLGLTVQELQVIGVRQMAIANLAGGADLATTVTKVNVILAMLRSHGLIEA